MEQDNDFSEFTESSYRRLLATAKEYYAFQPFGTTSEEPHVLWRHDVDLSVHRALRLAEIELEAGVRSTYFLWLHSPYYNLLEDDIFCKVRQILDMGHWIGLHFAANFYGIDQEHVELEANLSFERDILQRLLKTEINAFSFHDPETGNVLSCVDEHVAGMTNAYSEAISEKYKYVSDSNGYWRFDNLFSVIEKRAAQRLHVLTHPGWWIDVPTSPRNRILRIAEGRMAATMKGYDHQMKKSGRTNIS